MVKPFGLRTWIEIDAQSLKRNIEMFLRIISKGTRFMAVVKSNAYGHGLTQVAKFLANLQPTTCNLQQRLWFGVDSIVEAMRLREEGIKNPILVLGSTLSSRFHEAAENNIILTVSNFESLEALKKIKYPPAFHVKIDTGMHRQGFLPDETFKLIKFLKRFQLAPQGIYTHFASAKDRGYPTYTLEQLRKFKQAVKKLESAGFRNLIKHAAASGGTILYPETHLDMVRIGIGLYGYWPSPEAKIQFNLQPHKAEPSETVRGRIRSGFRPITYNLQHFNLKPILTWKTVVTEIKEIPAGSYVGYDLTERVSRNTRIAVLPVGYWHGVDRGLSSIGEVLIRGRRRKILGRVSMDMIVVDVTNKPRVVVGNEAVIIGRQVREAIGADEIALKTETSAYEVLTRINPLIERN